jgi:HEPN domain-containing protein
MCIATPFGAGFHAGQAVEKGLTPLLTHHGIDFPPKHDIGLLIDLLPDGTPTTESSVAGLTVYGADQRYVAGAADPMSFNELPTWDDAEGAISAAERALVAISDDLAAAFAQSNADESDANPA